MIAEYVAAWNRLDGFDQRPSAAFFQPEVRLALIQELEKLPSPLQRYLQMHVIGIFTVRNLGGSAMAGVAFDHGVARFGFLIVDVDVLQKPSNAWITFKEHTVFKAEPDKQYTVQIESSETDSIAAGIRFILMHETGHIAGQTSGMMMSYQDPHPDVEKSEFAKLSWASPTRTRFDSDFKMRSRVRFYQDQPPLAMSDAPKVYEQLNRTDLPTLYSCVDPHEEFAEAFALYVHSVLMQKHYEVRLSTGKEVTVLARDRILAPQFEKKRKLIEKVLEME